MRRCERWWYFRSACCMLHLRMPYLVRLAPGPSSPISWPDRLDDNNKAQPPTIGPLVILQLSLTIAMEMFQLGSRGESWM